MHDLRWARATGATEMSRIARILCVIGSILLLVTAALHGMGYPGISDTISRSDTTAFLKHSVPGLWAHFSIHLIVLAAFGLVLAFSARRMRALIALLTLAVAVDAAWVFSLAGVFAGFTLLVAAALCFALAEL